MLAKKQLVAFCEKQFKLMRLPYYSAYREFLGHYFHHFSEKKASLDDLSYYSDVALAHFQQILKHDTGKTLIDVSEVTIGRDGVYTFTRVLISTPDQHFTIESIRNIFIRNSCHVVQNNLLTNFCAEKASKKMTFSPVESGGNAYIWFDIENFGDATNAEIKKNIADVLIDIRIVVRDWRRMQDCLSNIMCSWQDTPEDIVSAEKLQEYTSFIKWMLKHFTFLGYHGYRYTNRRKILLKDKRGLSVKKDAIEYNVDVKEFPKQLVGECCPLLLFTQTPDRSTVHRDVYKDLIVLRVYNQHKKHWIEEHYFSGLLTEDAYITDPSIVPLLSQKYKEALEMPKLRDRYSLRRMEYILKSLPREELFRADVQSLSHLAHSVLMVQGLQTSSLFIRKDVCDQYFSVMVYVPRSLYTTRIRRRIVQYLKNALNGVDIQYTLFIADSVLSRLYLNVTVDPNNLPTISKASIEKGLKAICVSWDDTLYESLSKVFGQKKGYQLAKKYNNELSDQYRNTYSPDTAVLDIEALEGLRAEKPLDLRIELENDSILFRLFQCNISQEVSLKEVFPLLSNYGFVVKSEKHFEENIANQSYHLSEYRCYLKFESVVKLADIQDELTDAVLTSLYAKNNSDEFSNLLVISGLLMREVEIVRALCTYLHQIKFPLSILRMANFFIHYPAFSQSVIRYFNAKFQPKIIKREMFLKQYEKEILVFTELVKTSDDERIIRELFGVLKAIVRTNYGLPNQETIAFKISSNLINCMPKPAPLYELFVFSPRVMGVHLRFSKIARGGIRNSDRLDDVRHEVLELAKTQRLKNTLIVPDGAKGGFVCKGDLNAENEVLTCYKIFIRSMLSLTDNYVGKTVKQNPNLVIYDEEDPYFVVAADKGTATFSSYANEIAIEHKFWLGDAFASGGKNGYDHKKMGITARGAWESVKWHFLSKSHNVYETPFTVIGIGDMSGDVFGNGMLLSDKIHLLAAFNHASIFIDPNPCEKISFRERLRLFQLQNSSWADYNTSLISPGGGVYSRCEKHINLNPQMKKLFSTSKGKMEPSELIREILKLSVDLMWNGGIGVYVKSVKETHYQVSDFHNDDVRVDACELKASIIGEGGNNGLTQLGRVEFSEKGGMINTDFIDNSAGVNTSDVEVNFKILFQSIMAKKAITLPRRNHLLAKMANNVSEQVLKNNFLQNIQINLIDIDVRKQPDYYIQLIESMESSGLLNREIEKIPTKRELENRKKQLHILTRPEIAVLLSYSKIALYDAISPLNLGKHPLTMPFLLSYFPSVLVKKYEDFIKTHFLRDEIIATQLTNSIISEVGMLFLPQLCDECNAMPDQVIKSYLIVRESLKLEPIYQILYQHASKIDQTTFLYLLSSLQRAIYKSCRRLIRYQDMSNEKTLLDKYSTISDLPSLLDNIPKKYAQRMLKIKNILITSGISKSDADLICESRYFYQRFGIQNIIQQSGFLKAQVIHVYYGMANSIGFYRVKDKLAMVSLRSRWDIIQCAAIDDDLSHILALLTQEILKFSDKKQISPNKVCETWISEHRAAYLSIKSALNEITELGKAELSIFLIAIQRIKELLNFTEL